MDKCVCVTHRPTRHPPNGLEVFGLPFYIRVTDS